MIIQFNPESLLPLIKEQCTNPDSIIKTVCNCTRGFWESDSYFHCYDNTNVDHETHVDDSILLYGHVDGHVVLDISKNGNLAGVEYIDKS